MTAGATLDLAGELVATRQAYTARLKPAVIQLGIDEDAVLPVGRDWTRQQASLLGETLFFAECIDKDRAIMGGRSLLLTRVSRDGKKLAFYTRVKIPEDKGTWVLVIALHDPDRDVRPGPNLDTQTANTQHVQPAVPLRLLVQVE
ncbi:MAG: hypothetical protein SFV23_09255 [Planctomycetaceae bacterium]|nr:hypothetical protein [Planctomycetaceae bacterium]